MYKHTNYRDWLLEEYQRKTCVNPGYSLRGFSVFLGLPPTRLSDVINGNQGLSQSVALKIAQRLQFNKKHQEYFVLLVEKEHARSITARQLAKSKLSEITESSSFQLPSIAFESLSQWYHFALLELCRQDGGVKKRDLKKIAKRLRVNDRCIESSMERLKHFGLVEERANHFSTKVDFVKTTSDIPSRAVKDYHQDILNLAKVKLESVEVSKREYSANNVLVNPDQIESIKNKIQNFRRNLVNEIESSPNRTHLYNLSIQLFPLED